MEALFAQGLNGTVRELAMYQFPLKPAMLQCLTASGLKFAADYMTRGWGGQENIITYSFSGKMGITGRAQLPNGWEAFGNEELPASTWYRFNQVGLKNILQKSAEPKMANKLDADMVDAKLVTCRVSPSTLFKVNNI
eukprot:1331865-Amorphochlora_amoeboformis.AAC.1